jgi:hypothetical protein
MHGANMNTSLCVLEENILPLKEIKIIFIL